MKTPLLLLFLSDKKKLIYDIPLMVSQFSGIRLSCFFPSIYTLQYPDFRSSDFLHFNLKSCQSLVPRLLVFPNDKFAGISKLCIEKIIAVESVGLNHLSCRLIVIPSKPLVNLTWNCQLAILSGRKIKNRPTGLSQ